MISLPIWGKKEIKFLIRWISTKEVGLEGRRELRGSLCRFRLMIGQEMKTSWAWEATGLPEAEESRPARPLPARGCQGQALGMGWHVNTLERGGTSLTVHSHSGWYPNITRERRWSLPVLYVVSALGCVLTFLCLLQHEVSNASFRS